MLGGFLQKAALFLEFRREWLDVISEGKSIRMISESAILFEQFFYRPLPALLYYSRKCRRKFNLKFENVLIVR